MNTTSTPGILGFHQRLEERMDQALASVPFSASQRELLAATIQRSRQRSRANPVADPLALFYLIARAERRELDQQAVELGVFCQFYLLSLDLMDDVQDDDLAGKPHASAGPALASNNALTLLFLGITSLERAMRLEADPVRALDFLALLNRVALLTGRGQHTDLLGLSGARSRDEVLEMQRAKTASLTMICECAALFARVAEADRERYRRAGEALSMLVQTLDDLRDIYGKRESPDLSGRKMTYPLACFLDCAEPEALERFHALDPGAPGAVKAIRELFYRSGAVRQVAQALDRQRRVIHQELAVLGVEPAPLRTLLFLVDGLVSAVYVVKPVAESEALFAPHTPWHDRVRQLAAEFRQRLVAHDPPATPRLVPWHLPQWMYDARHGVVFYPDLEGLPEETLSVQSQLLGENDLEKLRVMVEAQAPAVLAHELFHHYRDVTGRMTGDAWLEELAANALAVAYCKQFEPDALARGLTFARVARERPANALSPASLAILSELLQADRLQRSAGYGVDLQQTAVIQLAMIERLAESSESLSDAMQRYLTPQKP
jgi:geranylgeranyl pyrophosphate synthase